MSSMRPQPSESRSDHPSKPGRVIAMAFRYTEGHENPTAHALPGQSRLAGLQSDLSSVAPSVRQRAIHMNGYIATPDPPPALYVRALYNYDADDHTSLSFRQGDIIQVLTQLESGWWDGVINDIRGWFPSNYCTPINDLEEEEEYASNEQDESDASAGSGTEGEEYEDGDESDRDREDRDSELPIEGGEEGHQEEASFWIPQATPDGRLYYFNTLTGVSKMELPLETPTTPDETGPEDRTRFHMPEQTRPPPEMTASVYENNDYDDSSASEADGESLIGASRKRSSKTSTGVYSSASMDSMSSAERPDTRAVYNNSSAINAIHNASLSMAPIGTTETSFAVHPHNGAGKSAIPYYFVDDGISQSITWSSLVKNMQISVEAYCKTIQNGQRTEFVRRAEDISDHLRMLLAAGSGTTDNHSGNPSIISTNKALYPHFREMMSKFSKLVLSSHIAAADWPGPEAYAKCLQEADGVLHGVYGYVDVACQQRGEEIPRITPGFVLGSVEGGNWQNNNIDLHGGPNTTSFMTKDEMHSKLQPQTPLDMHLIQRVDDARRVLSSTIRQLEAHLNLGEKIVTHARHAEIGDTVCSAAGTVVEQFRPWILQIESMNLAPMGTIFQKPQLLDFSTQKQKVYDAIGDLVVTCQAVTTPLADEWSEIRGDSLETRLNNVGNSCRQLESTISQVGYSLQLLLEAAPMTSSGNYKDHRLTDGGEVYQRNHLRSMDGSVQRDVMGRRPQLGDVGHSQSYTIGEGAHPDKYRRPNPPDKAHQFFGQMPPTHAALKGLNTELPPPPADDNPWYLQLEHPLEVSYDMKVDPPLLKSGTLLGLVEQLTRHDRLDAQFNGTFLLTYRSFTSAEELFTLLVRRFNVLPPAGLTRGQYPDWENRKQKLVRLRVVNILKTWFEHYWIEESSEQSQALLERAYSFAKTSIASTKTPGAQPLMGVIDQRLKGQDTSAKRLVLTLTNSAPAPILPKNMKKLKFLDIDSTEFARQLTIVESKLYGKIKPIECLDKTWQKKPKDENAEAYAPNVKSLILHSNQLTNWVAEMILQQAEVKKRVVVIKHFVGIADVSG